MTAEGLNVGRRAVLLVSTIVLLTSACTSEDVGDQSKNGTGTTSGVGSNAAGGASSVDTSGTRVNPGPTGSVVAPGGADSAAKTKGNRP